MEAFSGEDASGLLLGSVGKKRKKSGGGFSALGTLYLYTCMLLFLTSTHRVRVGVSLPVVKGAMRKGYRLPTPIQRKVAAH